MADLFTGESRKLFAMLHQLGEKGFTAEMVDAASTNPAIIQAMVAAARNIVDPAADRNPFETPPFLQLEALAMADHEEGWEISGETFARLAVTAPAWPLGRDSYRSFRIRFGEGQKGVEKTFEAHVNRIKKVHGEKGFRRWELVESGERHLRLLSGNPTHKPIVEWIIVHLDANRERTSVEDVRGPRSLADEGLVLAWLFPQRVDAIDYVKWSAYILAGYEMRMPGNDGSWRSFPCIYRNLTTNVAELNINGYSRDSSGSSVPVLGG